MNATIDTGRGETRLRMAGTLIGAGLGIELVTLFSNSPAAFLLFLGGGGALIAGGVLWFLYSLVAAE